MVVDLSVKKCAKTLAVKEVVGGSGGADNSRDPQKKREDPDMHFRYTKTVQSHE